MSAKNLYKNISILLAARGISQKTLTDATGVSRQALHNWKKDNKSPTLESVEKIADFFGVSVPSLLEEGGSVVQAFSPTEETPPEGYVAVPEFKLQFSAGPGCQVVPEWVEAEESEVAWYRESFFQRRNIRPDQCRRAQVSGDSMCPTICHGDTVLFEVLKDTSATSYEIVEGKIFVLSVDEDLKIKRVIKVKDGLSLLSDNPDFQRETYQNEECERVRVWGKVLQVSRNL